MYHVNNHILSHINKYKKLQRAGLNGDRWPHMTPLATPLVWCGASSLPSARGPDWMRPMACRALVMAGRPLMAVGDINHQRGYVVILHIYIYLCIQFCIICKYRTILYYIIYRYIILYLFYILCIQYVLHILQIFILCMINNILSIKYLHNHTAHIWLFASRSYVLVEFVRRMFDAWNWLDACLGIVIVRFWPLFWGAKQLIETAPNENWFVWNQQKTDILFKHHFFPNASDI